MWGSHVAEGGGSSSEFSLVWLCVVHRPQRLVARWAFFLNDFSFSVNTFELWILVNTKSQVQVGVGKTWPLF